MNLGAGRLAPDDPRARRLAANEPGAGRLAPDDQHGVGQWHRLPGSGSELAASVGWVLVVLRAFLGITFTFAGLQKLADRHFFDAKDPASIQAQLHAYQRHSPIHGLLAIGGHHAVLAGLTIAFGELAVGIGTLLGLWTRVAALGGMALSLIFFLSVSFHARPYYYGPDIVFVFAWTPLAIAGAGGVLSLDAYLAERNRLKMRLPLGGDVVLKPRVAEALARRTLLERGVFAAIVGAVTLLTGGAAAALGRLVPASKSSSAAPALGSGGASTPSGSKSASGSGAAPTQAPSSSPTSTAPGTAKTPAGTALGKASVVPVGGAASFTDPASGQPAYVVQPSAGKFVAFSAVCTHQGCTVGFSRSDKTFQCPCHGAVYDATTGQVLQGPAQSPLPAIAVAEGSNGELYVDG